MRVGAARSSGPSHARGEVGTFSNIYAAAQRALARAGGRGAVRVDLSREIEALQAELQEARDLVGELEDALAFTLAAQRAQREAEDN